ncbi:hypothetical protein ACZ90_65630 [Streptomyces albus subsp. albus]|nr:hypothetical protein ACZ90_65630 [Streptomyces albus subsp. albus]
MSGVEPGREQPGQDQGQAQGESQQPPQAPPRPPAAPPAVGGSGQAGAPAPGDQPPAGSAQPGLPGYPPPQVPGAPRPARPRPARTGRGALTGWVAAGVAAALLATGAVVLFTRDGSSDKADAVDTVGVKPDGTSGGAAPSAKPDNGTIGGDGDGGSTGGDSGPWGATGPLVKPAHTTGPDGTTIVVGKAGSGHTLDVYEDMRCPICAAFEQGAGETVLKDIKEGRYQARIHMAGFLDDSLHGSGSKNALSALGAALDVSPDAFLRYKHALYSVANHPQESTDSFADDGYLLKVAAEVPELKGNTAFSKAVTNGTYDPWARKVAAAFLQSGKPGVPEIDLDGRTLTSQSGGTPMTEAEYEKAVSARL